ncbi:5'-methylthioadenosine/S-adenosylhomocysteine nucleosidase [Peptococcaceae bacterium CEB3]|nr:5'-methylthioadenosine/S-adenosylhomocysteine nucleosidase [Peptococcaceae bacterium CEB3]
MRRVGIVAAWEPELSYLNSKWQITHSCEIAGWTFNQHVYGANLEVISVICGVGKVKCAGCTQLLITQFNPQAMYMTGICGGLGDKVRGGDVVVPLVTFQHDVHDAGLGTDVKDLYSGRSGKISTDLKCIETFRNFAQKRNVVVHYGTLVSGDRRIRDQGLRSNLESKYGAIAVDQEIAAFSHVCYLNNKAFFSIKGVSDKADDKTVEDQARFKLKAADEACSLLLDYLSFRDAYSSSNERV